VADNVDIWAENYRDEADGVALYEGLASTETDPVRAESFRQLAAAEKRHRDVWARKLSAVGATLPITKPSSRVRLLLWLARRLGTNAVLPMVLQAEAIDADKYVAQGGDAAGLAVEEEEHREVLAAMGGATPGSDARSTIALRERWHRGGRAGSIRAAVFGMNDGVVSNVSLVLGVAGTGASSHALVLTGVAGLLAGAASMAVGEYTSVASQRDLLVRQVEQERREIAEAPEEERAELATILAQKGMPPERAAQAAADIFKDPEHALDTLVREELGLDPHDLGNPLAAAGSSFAMFAIGAALPLIPFALTTGTPALVASCVAAAAVLTSVGAFLGTLAGTGALRSAARMLLLATLAATLTFAIGSLLGATVA
jgi:VIT1/CCC1 family predicted Fe2+/Mn2+ transporter